MFYIDDEKKKSENNYSGKSTDEITKDLVRIMAGSNNNNDDIEEEDLNDSFSTDPMKKGMKDSMGMIHSNDNNIIGGTEVNMLSEEDGFSRSQKLMKNKQKKEASDGYGNNDGIVFNNVNSGEDEFSEDLDEEDLDDDDDRNKLEKTRELEKKKKMEKLEYSPVKPIIASPKQKKEKSSSKKNKNATDTMIKKKKSPIKIAMSPVPMEEDLVNCYIIRDKGKLKIFPKYYLYAERGDEDVFLMAAKKRGSNKTSNYCVCVNKDVKRDGPHYIGKLRANMLGTKFYVYDKGEREESSTFSKKPVRKQMAAVVYEANILGTKGPRKMTAIIPRVTEEGKYKKFYDKKNQKLIDIFQKNGDWQDIRIFKNKGPTWNETLKAYVLNFNGRVTKPSVKNFQLVDPNNKEKVMLQFGRVSENKFTLDFRFPLSPFQAFAIALSAFDIKIACE